MMRRVSQRAVPMTRAGTVTPRATQHHGHAETDGEGEGRTDAVWPFWVQRCGIGSSGGCVSQDQMAGVQRDVQHATSGDGAAWQPGGRLAYELARILPRGGAADAAAGGSGRAGPGQRRDGAAATAAHRDMDGPAVRRHASTLVWPAWVQRCGIGSSCGCAPEDQMAGVQRDVQDAITGGGAPLHPGVLSRMGAAFSADFSSVRVHTGSAADEVASNLHANALTAGPDIVFRGGAYRPGTQSGDRLLAHELAHVVQQRDGLVRAPVDGGRSDPLERAADAAADDALKAAPSTPAPAGAGVGQVHGVGGGAGTAGNSPAQRRRDDRAPGGEEQQAAGIADEGGKRAPVRGAAASPVTVQRDATDDLADYIAHDLDAYVAQHPKPYAHILEVFKKLDSDIEDNVAAAFTKLQPSARLEEFAGDPDPDGLTVLNVLTEAMITGSVSLFESQQAERILIAKRKSLPAGKYAAQAERIAGLRHRAAPVFSEDDRARQIATDLNAYVENDLYGHVLGVFADLPSSIEDNVAAAFVEQQHDDKLKHFADTWLGYFMLQVLYNALITGNVSSFESLQAERILIAEAKSKWKWVTPGRYVSEAERIARLRDKAEDSPQELVLDAVATETAHVLSAAVSGHHYGDVTKAIRGLSSGIEDNVASHFIELQTPAKLEEFAADREGRAMLDVLYAAIITGSVTDFEKLQADRILEAKAKAKVAPPVPPKEYLEQLEQERQYVFPLRMQKTFRSDYAVFKATLQSNGKVSVLYDDEIHFWDADTFKEDFKNLPPYRIASTGFELNPDELVWVKLYDQREKGKPIPLEPIPAIALIDYANQAMRQSFSVGATAFETGLLIGGGLGAFSGAGAEQLAADVVAGEASVAALRLARVVLWADRIAMVLPAISLVINENREWIVEKFPNAGPALLGVLDQANRIAQYYGLAQMGVAGARYLKSKLGPALEGWRAERAALKGELSPKQDSVAAGIDSAVELMLTEADRAEAGLTAVKYVEEHPAATKGNPGERDAQVGNHHVKEVKQAGTGAVHCEYQSEPIEVIEVPCPAPWSQAAQDEPKPGSDPATTTEPKPAELPTAAAPDVPLSAEEQSLQALADDLQKSKERANEANQRLKELEKQGKDKSTPEHREQQKKVTEAQGEFVKAKNRLEAERRAQGVSPRQLYDRLRGRTPNTKMNQAAAMRPSPYAPGSSADHIVPVIDIVELPGFERLPPNMQAEVLNIPENTSGLEVNANLSKGDKLWSAKPGTSRYWEGHPSFGPVPADVRYAMAQAEGRARVALENAIRERLQKLGL